MLGQIIRYKSKNEKVYYIIIEINENNYVLYNPLYKRKSTINKLDKELFIVDDFDIKNLQSLYFECNDFFNSNKLFLDYNIKNPSSAQSKFYNKYKPIINVNHIMITQTDEKQTTIDNREMTCTTLQIGYYVNISISGKILNYDKDTNKYLVQTNVIKHPLKIYLSKKYNTKKDINININIYGRIMEYKDDYYSISTNIYEMPIKILAKDIMY